MPPSCRRPQRGQLPTHRSRGGSPTGPVRGDAARAHEEEPGVEDSRGIRPWTSSEGRVRQAGAVPRVRRGDPPARPHRRGRGGDLDPERDRHAVLRRAGRSQLGSDHEGLASGHRGSMTHGWSRPETEDVEFGADPVPAPPYPGRPEPAGGFVAEVGAKLDGFRAGRGRTRLGLKPRRDRAGQALGHHPRRAEARRQPVRWAAVPSGQFGDPGEEVAAGDPAVAARTADGGRVITPTSRQRPGDRASRGRPRRETWRGARSRRAGIRLAGDDTPHDLGD